MSKYRELVYMVSDELKLMSDDSLFNENHIIFLLDKFRAFLLKQKYADIKKQIPRSNYLEICLDLELSPAISGEPCEGGTYLKSTIKVPTTLPIETPIIYPLDFYQGIYISFISRERMRYVGYNKYLLNIIYCSLGPDNYLYFKSSNPQFLYLKKVKMAGVFENSKETSELQCSLRGEKECNILDREFPIEEALVAPLILLVAKELAGPSWRPSDNTNDANDDLSSLANFLSRNLKSDAMKQMLS